MHANAICTLLNNVSTTFASVTYTTDIATAAAYKTHKVHKVVCANVQLFANINAATSVFTNAVKKSASKIQSNEQVNVQQFTAQSNYFTHSNTCYSIVTHKQNNKQYLYCIFNNVQSSTYYINNKVASKEQVAQLLTKSAASKLLNNNKVTHNKTYNIEHNVVVRTIALHNILSITANKQKLTA